MKKYFLILGIIELIAVFIGACFISVIIAKGFLIYDVKETIKLIVLFIVYLIFAPALGLLFISHSRSLPEKEKAYKTENQQNNDIFVRDKKTKNTNEMFSVGDKVECIDINLLNKYGVNSEGKVVYIHGENIGVEFYTDKGHYTLSLSENQIKKY